MNSPAGTLDEPREQLLTHLGASAVYSPACASSPSRWSASSPPGSTRCASTCPRAACIRSASRELVGDGAALDAVLDQPLIYTQTNGTEALRDARSRRSTPAPPPATSGHQRRRRSQLPRRLESRAARRRGRDAGAELHADARPRARVRRRGARVAAGRGSRGRTLAAGPRSARRRSSGRGRAPSCCARPTTRPAPDSPPPISTRIAAIAARHGCWIRLRRDLPRRRARRRRRRRRCGAAASGSS